MQDTSHYDSPLGRMFLTADEIGLTGLWFEGQKYAPSRVRAAHEAHSLPAFARAAAWLDAYFSGSEPDVSLPLHLTGTDFQREVWALLCAIPYGRTTSYGEIAGEIAAARGLARMSAQAVGGAVGRNPIALIVPCHRVVGADGRLTGYAAGVERKAALLRMEGAQKPLN